MDVAGQYLSNNEVDKNLTISELRKVCVHLSRYCKIKDIKSKANIDFCEAMDHTVGSKKVYLDKYRKGKPRYGKGRGLDSISTWIDYINMAILDSTFIWLDTDPCVHKPLDCVFEYVELGGSSTSCATQHYDHSGMESSVYGAVTAAMQQLFPNRFDPILFIYQVIRTVH